MKFSLIIPAKNEEKRIVLPLLEYYAALKRRLGIDQFEIIIVINSTTDNTKEVVKTVIKTLEVKNVRIVSLRKCEGKGDAIIQGVKYTKGKYIGFIDADGSTSALSLLRIFNAISSQKLPAAFGSRGVPGAKIVTSEPIHRVFFGKLFNKLVRILFSIDSNDTQCGAKIFERKTFRAILPDIITKGWTFDINLYRSLKNNYVEVPVYWRDKSGSNLHVINSIITISQEIIALIAYDFSKTVKTVWQHALYFFNAEK